MPFLLFLKKSLPTPFQAGMPCETISLIICDDPHHPTLVPDTLKIRPLDLHVPLYTYIMSPPPPLGQGVTGYNF